MVGRERASRSRERAQEHTEGYAQQRAAAIAESGLFKKGRKITTREEAEASMRVWERRGHGVAYLVASQLGYDVHTISTFMAEMAPRSETEIHRHMNEAVIYILEGAGYTIFDVNGERVDWKAGDALSVPEWDWHQHFNPHGERVRYIATIDRPLKESLGVFKIEDHGPDAH